MLIKNRQNLPTSSYLIPHPHLPPPSPIPLSALKGPSNFHPYWRDQLITTTGGHIQRHATDHNKGETLTYCPARLGLILGEQVSEEVVMKGLA